MRHHGGDWAGYQEVYRREPLDFSANVSPLGMPLGARRAAEASLLRADRYPDPECRKLRRALGTQHGLDPEDILCGNGSADLLDRLALALRPRQVLIPVPAFTEYETALARAGCGVRNVPLRAEADFSLEEGFLSAITPDLDAVILCNPNNPTGRSVDSGLLEAVARRCGEVGALLIVDECFLDFLEDAEARTLLGCIGRYPLLVLRAFTKFYGMAGLRLGWCACADRDLLAAMRSAGQPWPVSTPAQAAGLAALEDEDYPVRLRTLIRTERPRLGTALTALGFRVIPGTANFLLFHSPDPALHVRLAGRGVLIRSCEDFRGLGPGWYRAAVRTGAENDALILALKEAAV